MAMKTEGWRPWRAWRFLRRQQLALLHHLSERIDVFARQITICFGIVVMAEYVLHILTERYPRLALLDAFSPESFLHVLILCCDVAITVLLVTYYLAVRVYLVHPNKRWALVLSPADFKQRLNTGPNESELALTQVEFAPDSGSAFEALIAINEEAFHDSPWALRTDDLRRRNASFIQRYPKAFMLFREPIFAKEYIGYSSIFPLTLEGADAYCNKAHGDKDMPSWFIAAPEVKPAAILIFAIALHGTYSFRASGSDRQMTEYFINCIWRHLLSIYEPWPAAGYNPPIWVQTEERSLHRKLLRAGFGGTSFITKDGLEVLEFKGPVQVRVG